MRLSSKLPVYTRIGVIEHLSRWAEEPKNWRRTLSAGFFAFRSYCPADIPSIFEFLHLYSSDS